MTQFRETLALIAEEAARSITPDGAFFGDDLAEAITGPEAPEAEAEIRRIIDEHLRAARARLIPPPPVVDWSDHIALAEVAFAAIKRAGDLRFVDILTAAQDRHLAIAALDNAAGSIEDETAVARLLDARRELRPLHAAMVHAQDADHTANMAREDWVFAVVEQPMSAEHLAAHNAFWSAVAAIAGREHRALTQ